MKVDILLFYGMELIWTGAALTCFVVLLFSLLAYDNAKRIFTRDNMLPLNKLEESVLKAQIL